MPRASGSRCDDDRRGLRARASPTSRSTRPARHVVELGTVGAHRITVDGELRLGIRPRTSAPRSCSTPATTTPAPSTAIIEVTEPPPCAGRRRACRSSTARRLRRLRARCSFGHRSARHVGRRGARRAPSRPPRQPTSRRRRRHQRRDRVRGLRPPEPRPARHARTSSSRRVVAANPRTVVVVNAGAPVLLPWLDEVPARAVGVAGRPGGGPDRSRTCSPASTEPTGRLPWTLPAREADVPVPHASRSTASSTTPRASTSGTAAGTGSAARPPARSATGSG